METVQQLADRTGIKANTIQKALRNFRTNSPDEAEKMGLNQSAKIARSLQLSPELAAMVSKPKTKGRKPTRINQSLPIYPVTLNGTEQPAQKPKQFQPAQKQRKDWKTFWAGLNLANFGIFMIRLSIFALGARASWGVFYFAHLLDPLPVAILEAFSLEFIYIGISLTPLDKIGGKRAGLIAFFALVVSILYNVLASAQMEHPGIFEDLTGPRFWLMAFLHGSPMAILAFIVMRFLFNHIKIK